MKLRTIFFACRVCVVWVTIAIVTVISVKVAAPRFITTGYYRTDVIIYEEKVHEHKFVAV